MNFRTELHLSPAPFEITHHSEIVLMGSCFAENIGNHFLRNRFKTSINSHGILFNPISIANALDDIIENRIFSKQELIETNGKFVSLNHHGKFSDVNPDLAIEKINESIQIANGMLQNAKVLIISFGSAWAWQHKATKQIVANCHKIPQTEFEKVLISSDQILERYNILIQKFQNTHPQLQVVFTISPVRYLRDGLIQNNLSKAHLFIAVHGLCAEFIHCNYFPAFEIVLDELRDYRFFKEDMLHPNEQAIKYVWEKFCIWCMNDVTILKSKQLEKWILLLEHVTMNDNNEFFVDKQRDAEAAIHKILA